MSLTVKKHISHEGKIIITICDTELLGKKIEEGEKQLDLSSNFYKGDIKPEEDILDLIKAAYLLNLVGKETIEFAKRNKLIEEKNICYISDIPYTQVMTAIE